MPIDKEKLDKCRKVLKDFRREGKALGEEQYVLDALQTALEVIERVRELETALDAWHNIFGTTQLSHAQARLEVAKQQSEKYREALEDVKNIANNALIKSITTDSIINTIDKALKDK